MRMNISDKILGKFADFIGQSSDFKAKKKTGKGIEACPGYVEVFDL